MLKLSLLLMPAYLLHHLDRQCIYRVYRFQAFVTHQDNAAMPKKVWNASTMSSGRSETTPFCWSCRRPQLSDPKNANWSACALKSGYTTHTQPQLWDTVNATTAKLQHCTNLSCIDHMESKCHGGLAYTRQNKIKWVRAPYPVESIQDAECWQTPPGVTHLYNAHGRMSEQLPAWSDVMWHIGVIWTERLLVALQRRSLSQWLLLAGSWQTQS